MMIDLTEDERTQLLDAINDSLEPGKHSHSDENIARLRSLRQRLAAPAASARKPDTSPTDAT